MKSYESAARGNAAKAGFSFKFEDRILIFLLFFCSRSLGIC